MDRSRSFVFTWPNYPDDHQDRLDERQPRYVCYGYEIAPTTGTLHLQGYIYFENARTLRALRRALPGVHIEVARGTPEQAITYCKKEGDFLEFGDPPQTPAEIGETTVERYRVAYELAKEGFFFFNPGKYDEIEPELLVRHYSTFKHISRDHMVRPPQLDGVCGVWIHGAAGSGKTTAANRAYPNAYLKPISKWWDGYQKEDTVILDDFGIYHREHTTDLKHWSDFLPFIAETKGAACCIRPRRLVVTSQYTLEDIWGQDPEALAALSRRFTVIEKVAGQDIML